MATYGAFGGLNAGGKKPTPMPGFGDPSPKAPASTGVNNPYSTEGPMPDGSTLAEHVRNGGSPYAGQIGHEFAPAAPKVDPNQYLNKALAGYQANIDQLNGMANPWESSMTIGALDRSRAGIAATGARANVHSQNDAIKAMMAGGGLMSQGDLANRSDNFQAGVQNQQNSLYADYNQRRIGWEDQRQQTLGNQYDRMAGLSEMPGRLEAQGLGNQMLNQQVWEYTTQDAANQRAAMRQLQLGNAQLDWQRNNQDTYEYGTQEAANQRAAMRQLQLGNAQLDWQRNNQGTYEYGTQEAANYRGLARKNAAEQGSAQLAEINQRIAAAQRAGDYQTANDLGKVAAGLAKMGVGKMAGGAIGTALGFLGPQAVFGGPLAGGAVGSTIGGGLDWLLGG